MSRNDDRKPDGTAPLTRRAALARLGLGAAAAYSAPVILHLDRSANATVAPTPCSRGRGRKAPWCRRRDRHDKHDRHERGDERGKRRGHDEERPGRSRGKSNGRGRG